MSFFDRLPQGIFLAGVGRLPDSRRIHQHPIIHVPIGVNLPVVARNKFCWGLGARAVRAGSIGREDPRLEENTASPKWGAGGLGFRPLPEDPSAL